MWSFLASFAGRAYPEFVQTAVTPMKACLVVTSSSLFARGFASVSEIFQTSSSFPESAFTMTLSTWARAIRGSPLNRPAKARWGRETVLLLHYAAQAKTAQEEDYKWKSANQEQEGSFGRVIIE